MALLSACSNNKKQDDTTTVDSAVVVTVGRPTSNLQQNVNLSGQVEAGESANISTRIMGYITKINVKLGDHVSTGQLLATISNDDILAKRAQADAMITEANLALKNAQKDFDRFTTLYQQQSASAKELENVTLAYNSAKARLEVAKQSRNELNATLNYTNLTAPFAGIITQKNADAGSMANPGMSLLTIEKSDSYQLSATAPENSISQIHTGASAVVTIASANKTFEGKVTQINQSSQFTGGQYLIKINIPERDKTGLYAGMYANVQVKVKQTINANVDNEQVMVPSSSIEYKNQLAGLYTIGNNNTALLRWVRLGKTIGSNVAVLSGLAANEQFILKADGKLYNGVQVKIK